VGPIKGFVNQYNEDDTRYKNTRVIGRIPIRGHFSHPSSSFIVFTLSCMSCAVAQCRRTCFRFVVGVAVPLRVKSVRIHAPPVVLVK